MLFTRTNNLFALPELLTHLLHLIKHHESYIQNSVSLHRQRDGVLCLVRSALKNIALSLQLTHSAKTHFLGFKDSTSGIFNCVVLSINYLPQLTNTFQWYLIDPPSVSSVREKPIYQFLNKYVTAAPPRRSLRSTCTFMLFNCLLLDSHSLRRASTFCTTAVLAEEESMRISISHCLKQSSASASCFSHSLTMDTIINT